MEQNLNIENLPNEIWQDIIGYEGLYQISNYSRVKSLKRKWVVKNKIIKYQIHKNGYNSVLLWKNRKDKRLLISRLVAIHFILNKKNNVEVNHKNGNKLDNRIENLEWITHSENIIHAHKKGLIFHKVGELVLSSKLKEHEVLKIRELYNNNYSLKEICKKFNICRGTIYDITHNKTWKHLIPKRLN